MRQVPVKGLGDMSVVSGPQAGGVAQATGGPVGLRKMVWTEKGFYGRYVI